MPRLLDRLLPIACLFLAGLAGCAAGARPGALRIDAAAAGPRLRVGDPAPRLEVLRWLRGAPVDPAAGGHVTVVDFWAPWSGPCLASMPRVTALERRHEGRVVVVALVTPDGWTTRTSIRRTVDEDPARFPSRIAIDRDARTRSAWMVGALEGGVPRAFVVDADGRLAWIGHPAEADPVVEALLAGTFDLEAARRERDDLVAARRAARTAARALGRAEEAGDARAIDAAFDELVRLDPRAIPYSPPDWIHLRRAERLAAAGRTDAAIAGLEDAAVRTPFASDGHALAAIAAAVHPLDPAAAAAIGARAAALLDAERDRGAAGDAWDRWIAVHPASARGPERLAALARMDGRLDDAVAWQTRAVAILEVSGIEELVGPARRRLEEDRAALVTP